MPSVAINGKATSQLRGAGVAINEFPSLDLSRFLRCKSNDKRSELNGHRDVGTGVLIENWSTEGVSFCSIISTSRPFCKLSWGYRNLLKGRIVDFNFRILKKFPFGDGSLRDEYMRHLTL